MKHKNEKWMMNDEWCMENKNEQWKWKQWKWNEWWRWIMQNKVKIRTEKKGNERTWNTWQGIGKGA